MLYDTRYRKKKISVYVSSRENYEDVSFLHDAEDIDYEFFIEEFVRFLNAKKEVPTWEAAQIYHTVDKAIRKAERKTRRHFDFSDTDTSEESSEGSEAENGSRASSREVFREAKLERFTNRITKRLKLLLVSEPEVLLSTIAKRKKLVRELFQDAKMNVAQVLPIIRRRPVN